jgi:propionyl-CoA carboxylase beta chain
MDAAMKVGAPVIGLNDSGGARIQEGVASLAGYAEVFQRNVLASGVVPQLSLIMGPCAGGAVYSPAMTDFIFMVKDSSYMFVTGPEVVKTVTNEVVTQEELGGRSPTRPSRPSPTWRWRMTSTRCWRRASSSTSCRCRTATRARAADRAIPWDRCEPSLDTLIPPAPPALRHARADPESRRRGRLLRAPADHAANIIIGFCRVEGRTVGVVANQPMVLAGVLDIKSLARRRRASCASATRSTSRS